MQQKKIKSNNFDACKKQCATWESVNVPTEINEEEKHLYHLLFVEVIHRAREQRYDIRQSIIKLNVNDYIQKVQKRNEFAILGYTNLFVLHDPTKKVVEPKKSAKIDEPKIGE